MEYAGIGSFINFNLNEDITDYNPLGNPFGILLAGRNTYPDPLASSLVAIDPFSHRQGYHGCHSGPGEKYSAPAC